MAVKASATITLNSVVDIKATYRYYLLQSSTLPKPAKPTTNPPTNPPGGSWTDAEPTYTSGSTNSLYFVDLTVFSDDKFTYSSVSKSTSYEAAKEAYNKAQNAQDSFDNLEIGGRNLFSGYGEEEIRLGDYTATNPAGSFSQFYNHLTFNPGETVGENYTISLWAKSPNGNTRLMIYNTNGKPRYFYFSEILTESLGDEWTYFKLTITNNDMGPSGFDDTICNRIEIYAPSQMGVLVKKIKVEKGNKATDWTPAPEDVQNSIDNVDATASEADRKANELTLWKESDMQMFMEKVEARFAVFTAGSGHASLWEQTPEGFSFSFADAKSAMLAASANSESISGLTGDLETANKTLDDLKNELAKNAEYIKFTTVESEETRENILVNSSGPFITYSMDSNYGFQDLLPLSCYSVGGYLYDLKPYTLIFDWSVDWRGKTPVDNVEARIGNGESFGDFESLVASMIIPNLSSETSGRVYFPFIHSSGAYIGHSSFTIQPVYCSSKDALDGTTWTISNVRLVEGTVKLEPCIELGVSQEGKYKVLITNTRIIFKEGSATPTYISNETLVSEKVEITQELHHTNTTVSGGFVWKMRQNGNLGLSWKGV